MLFRTIIQALCVYRIGVVECDPFNSVHALHRMTAKLNYVPFATRIILNEFKKCVQWFENCSCVCECVLNAAENYVLTCSHLRTTFVIQHKLHTRGLSARASKHTSPCLIIVGGGFDGDSDSGGGNVVSLVNYFDV